MARGEVEWISGVKCFTKKRLFISVCCVNAVLSVFLLRSLYYSFSVSFSTLTDQSSLPDVLYAKEQNKRVEESMRIRQALEPMDLVAISKKLKKEFRSSKKGFKLSKEVNQKLAFEILSRLKWLANYDNVTEQREMIESWRTEKLQEIRRLLAANSISPGTSSKGAKKLGMILEFHWQKFLESIGFWMPSDVANTVVNDKPDNADEQEEIIPGRPMPSECNVELHTDYAGAAVRWGLTHHTESAADCCQACLDQAKGIRPGEMKCNIWVYCPSEFGCYSPDIYEHKHQECWLKQDEKPQVSFKDNYSESYRNSHPSAPVVVPWMSGVIT